MTTKIYKHINYYLRGIILAVTMLFSVVTIAQNAQVGFGQNRVQYKDFDWQFYETDNFNVYFYQGGQDIGKYVIQASEVMLDEIIEKLDFRLGNRLNIIVYNDISDLHQTNIGIKQDADYVNGTTKILDNKLFVYFNGNHADLDRQIKEGITRVYLEKLMAGSGFQEVIQNALLLNLPNWFTEGLIAYVGTPWTTEDENKLRASVMSGEYKNLSKLPEDEMAFVGHSIWHYIEQKYGVESVANLLYLVRVNKSVEKGIMFVTGSSFDAFLSEWYYFNKKKFETELAIHDTINFEDAVDIKYKKDFSYYEMKMSPNGKLMAYAENDIGRWRVKVYDLESKKTQTLIKGGFRTNTLVTDESVPMLAWSPTGSKLTVIYEKRDEFYLTHFNTSDWKKEEPQAMRKFQKVYGFAYGKDDRNLVVSAMQKAQVDVFTYYMPSTKVVNLTDDFYDDLQPSFANIDGREGVLFVSNRPNDSLIYGRLDTILPNGTFDVFFYDLNNSIQPLAQLTQTPKANESHPQEYSDSTFTFLSDYLGVNHQYVGTIEQERIYDQKKYTYTTNEYPQRVDTLTLDPSIDLSTALDYGETLNEILNVTPVPVYRLRGNAYRASNFFESISAINTSANSKKLLVQSKMENKQHAVPFAKNNKVFSGEVLPVTQNKPQVGMEGQGAETILNEDTTETQVTFRNPIYQSKFDGWEAISEKFREQLIVDPTKVEVAASGYEFRRTRQYFIKFKTEEVSFSMDNSQLITPYQPFNPGSPVFNQPGFNALMRFGITDLFENHKIHGGFRFPTSFNGTEVYVTYENFKKRWDKSLTFYRKTSKDETAFQYQGVPFLVNGFLNTRTNIVETNITFPIDIINSIRFKFGFRNDRSIIKSTDIFTLNTPNFSSNWLLSRVEFVHDHTVNKAVNIKNGLRLNAFFEFQKEIPTREDTIFNDVRVQLPQFDNAYLMLWGFDARYYQKVYKTITWANRLAYTTSIGTKKMIYYLGGTDNMLFPTFNTETPVNTNNNYAFQSLAYHMRGYQQNVRNGNSFMVLNSELRVPLFSAFSRRPIKSALLENLQVIAFVDIGTAWEGVSPFSNDNPLFEETVSNQGGSAVVRLKVQKQPVVVGFGTGIRTNLLGYYVRTDIGWGYDTGAINKPRLQVSLGYDF